MQYALTYLLCLGTLLLSACDSGSNSSSDQGSDLGSDNGPKHLSLLLLDRTEHPVSGVTVILHGPDDISIAKTRISDADGVVDFGDIDNRKVSMTVYSPLEFAPDYLATFVAVDPGEITLYIKTNYEQSFCFYTFYEAFDENGSTSMNYLINIEGPIGGEGATPFLGGGGTTCASLQNDGNISAIAFKYSPFLYGLSIDQAPFLNAQSVDEARMPIQLQYKPASLTYSGLGAQVMDFSLSAHHKGKTYTIYDPNLSGSPFVLYADLFPAEYYIVNARFSGSGRVMLLDSLKSHIDVPLVDIQLYDHGYNTAENLVYWNRSGTTEVNLQTLFIQTAQDSTQPFWYVHLPASSKQWKFPDLSADILNAVGGRNNMPYRIWVQGWYVDNNNYNAAIIEHNKQSILGTASYSSAYSSREIPVPEP